MALTKITNSAIADDIGLGGNPTTSTQTAGNSTTRIATTAFVSTAVANLVDSAPETLNTLAELATSIGNNATLSSTLTSSIATKLPLAGGTLTGHLNLGDNVRARFGIGNDLQIYHNNNSSYIRDLGEGSLYIDTNGPKISLISDGSYSNGKMADFVRDGAVTLYYDNALKLATTTIGIDVTGSVLTDGLTSAGTILATSSNTINTILRGGDGNSKNLVFQKTTGSAQQAKISAVGDDLRFTTGTTTERMRIDSSGNVGIGTTAPGSLYATARQLVIGNGTADVGMTIYTPNTGIGRIFFADGLSNGDQYAAFISYDHSNHKMQFGTGNTGTTDVTIDQYGNVGIGTTGPAQKLHVQNASGTTLVRTEVAAGSLVGFNIKKTGSTTQEWNIVDGASVNGRLQIQDVTDNRIDMTFDGTGKIGIGTTIPKNTLDLGSSSQGRAITFANYSNLTSEYSNASLWLSSNFYPNAGATGYKTGATGNFGAAAIRVHGTGGTSNSGVIQFYADLNTSKTADAAFTPTERMRISADGNVGIGTSNPIYAKLQIESATDQGLVLHLQNKDQDSNTYMRYKDWAGQYWDTGINWANNDYYFSYGGVFKARFTNAGGLQIDGSGGSTAPTLALNSTVSSTFVHSINALNANLVGFQNQIIVVGKEGTTKNSGYIGYKWIAAANNGNMLTFGHWGNNNLMNLTANGKLGIGTEGPIALLDVMAGVGSSIAMTSSHGYSQNRNWALKTNNYGSGNWGGFSIESSTSVGAVPGTAMFGIDIAGNCGIGIGGSAGATQASAKLHVGGHIRSTGQVIQGNSDGTPRFINIPYASAASGFTFDWQKLANSTNQNDQEPEHNAFMFEVNVTSYLGRYIKAIIVVDTNATNSLSLTTLHNSTITMTASIPTGTELITLTFSGLWGNSVNFMGRITTF